MTISKIDSRLVLQEKLTQAPETILRGVMEGCPAIPIFDIDHSRHIFHWDLLEVVSPAAT